MDRQGEIKLARGVDLAGVLGSIPNISKDADDDADGDKDVTMMAMTIVMMTTTMMMAMVVMLVLMNGSILLHVPNSISKIQSPSLTPSAATGCETPRKSAHRGDNYAICDVSFASLSI